MADFDVKTDLLLQNGSDMQNLKKKLDNLQDRAKSVKNGLAFSISSSQAISIRINQAAEQVSDHGKTIRNIGEALGKISKAYTKAENDILAVCKDGQVDWLENAVGSNADKFSFGTGSVKIKNTNKKRKGKSGKVQTKTWKKGYYDKDPKTGKWTWHDETPDSRKDGWDKQKPGRKKKETIKDKLGDVKVVNYELWDKEAKVWGIKDDEGNLTYDVKLGAAETHGNAYCGLMGFDADGNKVFRPGIGAEIGASVTGFTAAGQAMIGDDMLGGYVGGNVTVGRASAQADAAIGFADGQFAMKASASAEVIGAEASVNAGGKILGTDVKATAGVNVGLGAHADVGYKNGKFSVDVGASVGLGVSVKLDIDVSGTVKNIKKVGKTVSKAASKVASFFGF